MILFCNFEKLFLCYCWIFIYVFVRLFWKNKNAVFVYFRCWVIYFIYINSFQLLNLKYLKYLLSKSWWYIYILTKFSYIFKVLYVLYVVFTFNPWHFCCLKIYYCKFYLNMLMCDITCVVIVCVDFVYYFCLIIVIITSMSIIHVIFI